jgi:hypothetical protein
MNLFWDWLIFYKKAVKKLYKDHFSSHSETYMYTFDFSLEIKLCDIFLIKICTMFFKWHPCKNVWANGTFTFFFAKLDTYRPFNEPRGPSHPTRGWLWPSDPLKEWHVSIFTKKENRCIIYSNIFTEMLFFLKNIHIQTAQSTGLGCIVHSLHLDRVFLLDSAASTVSSYWLGRPAFRQNANGLIAQGPQNVRAP